MKIFRNALALAALAAILVSHTGAQPPTPVVKKKKLLAIGVVDGFQHDSVSNGLATMWKIGHDTGLWDTYIRTDTQLITKKKIPNGNAHNLDYFDAIYIYATGEWKLDDEQKASLLAFVHEDGKGIIGGHSAIDSNYKWPEYGEMMGAYFDQHPWNQFLAPVIVEDPNFPGMRDFPKTFTIMDEIYQPKDFSREKVHVLARLDESKLDLANPRVHRADKDFAVAWIKTYGKGRVFYTTFGHRDEVYDRADIQTLYREATKWAMRLTDADATPRPRP